MKILIDNDSNMNFEVNSTARKIFNFIFIPILNILPVKTNFLIRRSHKSVDEVVENATTHAALEVLYKKGHKHHTINTFQKLSHAIWFNTNNSKAVRNRLKIVKRELTVLLKELSVNTEKIKIVSIASGSARAIVESIVEANLPSNLSISSTFVDKSQNALSYSKELLNASSLANNHNHNYDWVNATAGSFLRNEAENTYDIIEMVGLLDYFDDEKAIDIFRSIHKDLNIGGTFITANICPNEEQKFLTKIIKWEMVYRRAEDLASLLIKAGFEESSILILYEPLKVHCIAIAKK
jgi:hypothetical protein